MRLIQEMRFLITSVQVVIAIGWPGVRRRFAFGRFRKCTTAFSAFVQGTLRRGRWLLEGRWRSGERERGHFQVGGE